MLSKSQEQKHLPKHLVVDVASLVCNSNGMAGASVEQSRREVRAEESVHESSPRAGSLEFGD